MTDSKTATERLREMLDARGVEYVTENIREVVTVTQWTVGDTLHEFNEVDNGLTYHQSIINPCTPEQAIAATLGSGKCELESSYYYDDYDQYELEFSCGYSVKMYDKEPPNYCPNCGRRVVNNDNQ